MIKRTRRVEKIPRQNQVFKNMSDREGEDDDVNFYRR